MYPYFFLDQSQKGQLNKYRQGYIIGAQDFELYFKVSSNGNQLTAKQHETEGEKISLDEKGHSVETEKSTSENQIARNTNSYFSKPGDISTFEQTTDKKPEENTEISNCTSNPEDNESIEAESTQSEEKNREANKRTTFDSPLEISSSNKTPPPDSIENVGMIKKDMKGETKELKDLYSKIESIPNYPAKINDFLRQFKVHSIHRRIVKKTFPRRHIIVHVPYQIFMADLIEYTRNDHKHINQGFAYILIVINVFTMVVYARAIKREDKFSTANAFSSIFQKLPHYPNTMITDEGLEFYNMNVKEVFDSYAIHHYSIKSKMKASVVERVIRTLKSRLEKFFSYTGGCGV